MYELKVKGGELYNNLTKEFIYVKPHTLIIEHSLISLHAWEAIWHIPFLGDQKLNYEQIVSYIKCMTLNHDVDPNIYLFITDENIKEVNAYIDNPMTATWFGDGLGTSKKKKKRAGRIVTAELLYYYMLSLNIPFECRKWHLNQLITLIKVCNEENETPNKKVSKRDFIKRRDEINEMRKKQLHTTG